MNRRLTNVITLIAVFALSACSNESGGSGLVTVATGGTVLAGSHSVSIPPASLAADTEVVLQTGNLADYAPLEGASAQVLELLPAGTVLETPATVTIGSDLVGLDEGETVSIHQYRSVDGESFWAPMEFELQSGGSAAVPVTVFAPLAVVVQAASSMSTVQGTLTWAGDGSPVSGATLELWQGSVMLTTATTSETGTYSFEGLEAGSYSIQGNPECAVNESVSVPSGTVVTVDIAICG